MATPQESTTTFQGRLCTRTRVRTSSSTAPSIEVAAAASEPPATTTSSLTTTSTSSVAAPPAIQTSSPAAAAATTTAAPDTQPAPATTNPTSSVSSQASSSRRPLAPSPAVALAPNVVEPSEPTSATSNPDASSVSATTPEAAAEPTPTPTPVQSSDIVTSVVNSLLSGSPNGGPNAPSSPSTPVNRLTDDQPQQTDAPPGGSVGMISPEKGGGVPGAALGDAPRVNIGGIVGGVMGGFVGIALAGAILFLCLRRRRSRVSTWPPPMNEKYDSSSESLVGKVRDAISSGNAKIGGFFAKMKGKNSEQNHPYRRQSARSSISSVYSARAVQRPRSTSEPPWRLREQLRGFGDRMPSLKRSRTLLGKRKDSLVTGSKSPFPAFVEDPLIRNSNGGDNPFVDPPLPRRFPKEGLQDQQRAPITPRTPRQPPPVAAERGYSDPFASILDELEERERSSTPDWLREEPHKRTQSYTTALRSHPPSSFYTASVYTNAPIDPFLDPDAPPVPSQPLPPDPPQRPLNTFTGVGGAYAQASNRESDTSFSFGEPGPSRPTTQMFSAANVPRPMGRQSDPFDLDRPEVLGFGNVRRERASVTRQNSKNNRGSSVPNFGTVDDWYDRKRNQRA